MIFPDNIYALEFKDYEGNPIKVEILGSVILDQVRDNYLSETKKSL